MFEALKKKLSSWLGKAEEKGKKKKSKKEKAGKKAEKKPKPEKKPKLEKKSKKKIDEKAISEKRDIISKIKSKVKIEEKKKEPEKESIGKVTSQETVGVIDIEIPETIEGEEEIIITKKKEEVVEINEKEEIPAPPKEAQDENEKKGFFSKLKDKFLTKSEKKEEEEVEKIIEEASHEETEKKEEVEEEKGNFFSKFFKKLSSAKINEENFNEIFSELEIILLENNVALEVVEKIREHLKKSLIDLEVKRTDIDKKITGALKEAILDVLIEPDDLIKQIESKQESPYVILFFGINGSGKTTSIAKLAHKLKHKGIPVVMAAADTFRAASIEQLKTHGERIGVEVIAHDYGADPAAVAFDAIQHAKKNHLQVVLIDTAGRMYTKSNLMKEMEKIVRVSKPDLKIFVGESITGNDATEQAKTFKETAGIDGIILSKADVDEKAGTILSVSYVTKKPIYFLGVGQEYKDLKEFKKSDVLRHLGLE